MWVECTFCKTRFFSTLISAKNATIELHDNKVQCPGCSLMTPYPEGEFNFDGEGKATLISEIRNMKLSSPQIEKLKSITETAKEGMLSEEEFKEEIQKISNSLTGLFPYLNSSGFTLFLTALLFILSSIKPSYRETVQKRITDSFKRDSVKTEKVERQKKEKIDRDSSYTNLRRLHRKWNQDTVKPKVKK